MEKTKILAEKLFLISKGKTNQEKKDLAKSFVASLKKNKKFFLLPEILKKYKEYLKNQQATLILARILDNTILNEIKENQQLKKILKDKIIKIKIDKNIIGGFIAQTNDYLVDGSTKGFLNKIKKNIL